MTTNQRQKLEYWQDKLTSYENAFAPEVEKMDRREEIYRGRSRIDQLVDGDVVRSTPHVRNIAAELIEAQVDANIPQPKVTALRRKDEHLAALIEDMLRNKLGQLPMEILNDQMERTVPIQGGGLFSWVEDTILADLEDCQGRILCRCHDCGAVQPGDRLPQEEDDGPDGDETACRCPLCGGQMETALEEYQELWLPVQRSDGSVIPGADPITGQPNLIPYYKPDIFPVFLQKSVSVYGQLLGESDVDKVADQQNTINRLEKSIIDQLLASGSYITLPPDPSIRVDTGAAKAIRLKNVADRNYLGVYDLKCDVEQPLAYMDYVYQEARDLVGITDSYQGRKDTTATSGVAKEFAANQTAGRLQSKRVMKNACWARLFEALFKFELAYADERRPVIGRDENGEPVDEEWNRWDFLEQEADGAWRWNDRFLFSCDSAQALAADRTAMWQETQAYFTAGAFGDPTLPETRLLFWRKMEQLHYPGASQTKQALLRQQTAEPAIEPKGVQTP
ncbi:MAG: hypothetical protein LUE22_04345 [Oscillospiraceae bacterium]|nr:hypothetical protein [Oscillospiraceae bacterium]